MVGILNRYPIYFTIKKWMPCIVDICTPGSFFNKTSRACEYCGRGYYQPLEGQSFCESCGLGNVTRMLNATSPTQCVGKLTFNIVTKQFVSELHILTKFYSIVNVLYNEKPFLTHYL